MLAAAGVPCGPVNSVAEALAEPQTAARDMIVTTEHPHFGRYAQVASPVRVGDDDAGRMAGRPRRHENADELFTELLGYDETTVRDLVWRGSLRTRGGARMTLRAGWQGRYFEDFEVGDVYRHPLGRTVSATDNTWFTMLTQNTARVHFDAHYASQTEFGQPLVELHPDSCACHRPVGDRRLAERLRQPRLGRGAAAPSAVRGRNGLLELRGAVEARQSRSRPQTGLVTVRTKGFTPEGKVVITFKRTVMVYLRGHGPTQPEPTGEAAGLAAARAGDAVLPGRSP